MQEFSRAITAADMHMAQLLGTPVFTNNGDVNGAGGKALRPTVHVGEGWAWTTERKLFTRRLLLQHGCGQL